MDKEEKKVSETQEVEWEELIEKEDMKDESEFDKEGNLEENPEEDFEEDLDEEGFIMKPWMIPAFAGMLVLAILICIPLWKLTHRSQDTLPVGTETNVTVESVGEIESEENLPTEETEAVEETSANVIVEAGEVAEVGQTVDEGNQGPADDGQASDGGNQEAAGAGLDNGEVDQGAAEVEPGTEDVVQDPISGNASMSFTEVSESVTAKDVTNLRSVPSTEDSENVVGQLKNGEVLERTGVNANTGWSRLLYNGETVYAVTQFVTTNLDYKPPVTAGNPNRVSTMDGRVIIFSDCDDYVTPKEYVNLRTEPSTSEGDSTIRVQVHNGESVHRTGYSSDSGWSRVEYNGEVLYVVSSLVQGVTAE